MGDRANVFIKKADVFIYTHGRGCELAIIVCCALRRSKERWKDGPYLARIVFSEMIRDGIELLDGYGISSHLIDNQHSIIVLDPVSSIAAVTKARNINIDLDITRNPIPFINLITMSNKELCQWYMPEIPNYDPYACHCSEL